MSVQVFTRSSLEPVLGLVVTATSLENAHLKVAIGKDGAITSLIHKATGREALADGATSFGSILPTSPATGMRGIWRTITRSRESS